MTISSLTRPPWSMIFLASRPNGVFLATCDRSMSPVAYGVLDVFYFLEDVAGCYQMAAGKALFDIRCLSSLAYMMLFSRCSTRLRTFQKGSCVPAPGGPIKTILTPSLAEGFGPPETWWSLSSSSLTLDSSFWTISCSDCTVSSRIGGIVKRMGYVRPDQGEEIGGGACREHWAVPNKVGEGFGSWVRVRLNVAVSIGSQHGRS
jgi:hypothetical protein